MSGVYGASAPTLRETENLLQGGIQPQTRSRLWVPRTDLRYRFLVGNGKSLDGCGRWMWRGCLDGEAHQKHEISAEQLNLFGAPAERIHVAEAYHASCGRLQCPVCYEKACGKEAAKIAHRIMEFRAGRMKPIHVAVSVPEVQWDLKFRKMRKLAYELAMEVGVIGGSIIFHPFRKWNEDDQEDSLKDGFSWKEAPACWYISPHFHIIGYGWIHGERVKSVYKRTSWIIKNLGVRNPLQGQTIQDAVRATAHYQLSHCGVNERFHTVVWFGALSYGKLHVAPIPEQKHECPLCGSEMRGLVFLDPATRAIVESNLKDEAVLMVPEGMFRYRDGSWDPGG